MKKMLCCLTTLLCMGAAALSWAYAPLTIINQSDEKLGLQNPTVPIPGTTNQYPVLIICPKGSETPDCPSEVTLQISNAGGPYDWQYTGTPYRYFVAVKTQYDTPELCPPPTDGQDTCLFCYNNQPAPGTDNPVDKYGNIEASITVPQTLILNSNQPRCVLNQPVGPIAPNAPPPTHAPYQLIDVGKNYTLPGVQNSPDPNHPFANLQNYFDAQGASTISSDGTNTITMSGPLTPYLTFIGTKNYPGILYVAQNISASDYASIQKNGQCTPFIPNGQTKADPYKLVCSMTFTTQDGKGQLTMPIILNNGLRALGMSELMSNTMGPNAPSNMPFIMEIAATPSDFDPKTPSSPACASGTNSQGQAILVGMVEYFSLGAYTQGNPQVGSVKYEFDASPINGGTQINGKDSVRLITEMNVYPYNKAEALPPQSVNDGRFYFNQNPNPKLSNLARLCYNSQTPMQPGIYQINIKATGYNPDGTPTPGEVAYTSIYLNVHPDNPTWKAWAQHAAISNTNLFNNDFGKGAHPVIGAYTYSSGDAAKNLQDFTTDYVEYAKNIATINQAYLSNQPITTALGEIMGLQYGLSTDATSYLYPISYWPVCANPAASSKSCTQYNEQDPTQNIQVGWVGYDQPSDNTWLPALTTTMQSNGVGLTVNFALANVVKSDMTAYNPTQINLIADKISNTVDLANLDGVSLDPEGALNSPAAVDFYKALTDRLAYQGKWFGFYYFADMFTPDVIGAFGPIGQALVSGYDMATYRATPQSNPPAPAPSPSVYSQWTTADTQTLSQAYEYSLSCSSATSTPYRTKSWCNVNINDAASESYRLWNSIFSGTWSGVPSLSTPAKAFKTLNGKYQIVMPVSWSATLWSTIEIFNPDFTQFVVTGSGAPAQQGYILANTASSTNPKPGVYTADNPCKGLDNAWLKSNWNSDTGDLNPTAVTQLSRCIFKDQLVQGVPIQSYSSCGTIGGEPIPYNQCITISSLPGGSMPGYPQPVASSQQAGYLQAVASIYQEGDGNGRYTGYPNNLVGMSAYAIENAAAAPNSGAFLCGTEYNTVNPPKTLAMYAVQQPFSVGTLPPSSPPSPPSCGGAEPAYDPYYYTPGYSTLMENAWQAFNQLLKTQ